MVTSRLPPAALMWVVLLLLSALASAGAYRLVAVDREGASAQRQDGAFEGLPLGGRLEILRDPTRAMTFGEVLKGEGDFRPLPGTGVNFGYIRDVVWLRFSVRSRVTEQAYLALTPSFSDLVDVYVAPERPGLTAADFQRHALGDHRPLPSDAISGLDSVVPLNLGPDHPTLVYIRLEAINNSMILSLALYPANSHTRRVTLRSLAAGLWFGSMGALLAIQLVFFHFDRKPFYPLLALSTLGAMLVYTGNLGLSRLLLFPGGGTGNDLFTALSAWFGLFASSLAGASILELPRRAPLMNQLFRTAAGVGLLGMVLALLGLNLVFSPYGNFFILVLGTLAVVLGFTGIDDRGVGTRLRAMAYLILWMGLAVTIAQRSGYWQMPNWVAHSYAVTSLIQTLLLTGSLAVRLRAAEAMNKAMSAQALESAQAAERRASAMVEQKTRELAAAKQTAEDALRAELDQQEEQVRFMEVISHQSRTPLAAIRSNVDSIALSLPVGDAANRDRIERVRRGIVRLIETLEINLARSRLQGPSFAPHRVRTSLGHLAETAVARSRDLLPGEIVVRVAPAAADVQVLADAGMLGIAIINLIENAVKYSAATVSAPVEVSCAVEGRLAVVAVSDRGIGIPDDEIASIMGRSVRGSNARSVEGSGIGLSLVARIAAAHDGTVEINSRAGEGTTIRIVMPRLPG